MFRVKFSGLPHATAGILLAATPALGGDPATGDWLLECRDGLCVLSQTAVAEDRTWLATLRLALAPDPGVAATLQVLVPPQVHLGSGLFLTVDGGPARQIDYIRCAPERCEAAVQLDEAALQSLRRGRVAELRYRPNIDAPPVAFDVSLTGITAGTDAAKRMVQ